MLKLHTYFRSSCSYRVRIALNLKGLTYESLPINLLKSEQLSEDYMRKNPSGLLPTFRDEKTQISLTQSLAIIEYIDENYGEKNLFLPADSYEKALVRSMAYIIACDIQPIQNLKVLKHLMREIHIEEDQKIAWIQHFITEGFFGLEAMLKKHSGEYCYKNKVSLVDICLIPQLYNARRFKTDLSRFPNITKVEENLLKLESFEKAKPENQIDCPF